MYNKSVKFEFDEVKSQATKNDPNRGFDFVDVQSVWLDPHAITIPARIKDGEARNMILGLLGNKVIAVIYTIRMENVVRIISARPAREIERKFYEEQKE